MFQCFSLFQHLLKMFIVMKNQLDNYCFHYILYFHQMLKRSIIMKITPDTIGEQALETIRTVFGRVPFLEIKSIEPKAFDSIDTVEFLVVVEVAGIQKRIAVEVNTSGEPRYARQAIQRLSRLVEKARCSYGVFLAPYISPGAAGLCAQSSIGTIDLSGNCRISFDSVYIENEGRPNRFAGKRTIRSLYSPKASRVLRVLLLNPEKSWKTQELVDEAKVSLGQVANVKKLLADREWISGTAPGFMLSRPSDLLMEWSENYSYEKNEIYDYYSLKQPAEIENSLAAYCENKGIEYALTGFSGANRIAPSVHGQRVMAYVSAIDDGLENALDLKKVASGANVTLFIPYDEGVYYGSAKNGIRLVSPVQVYLDLKKYRGRGEEAAAFILSQVIEKSW